MKFIGLAILAILSGYNGGLIFDAFAQSNDSGKFEKKLIPFGLGDTIVSTQNFLFTYPFEGGPYIFQNAFLAETDALEHAYVNFNISTEQKPDGSFSTLVTECVFETDVDINTECVVCIFRDSLGINIAKGSEYFVPPYIANTPLTLEMTEFLNDDKYITEVRNVKGIQIGICEEESSGDNE